MRVRSLAPVLFALGAVLFVAPAFAGVQRTVFAEDFGFFT